MTAQDHHDRPGTQRTDHLSHQRAQASRSRCLGCPHKPENGVPEASKCPPSTMWHDLAPAGQNNRLSQQMFRVYADIEAEANNLDSALRRTWLWLASSSLQWQMPSDSRT
jgi:hypothetical protein